MGTDEPERPRAGRAKPWRDAGMGWVIMRAMGSAIRSRRHRKQQWMAMLCAWSGIATLAASGAHAQSDIWYGRSASDTAFVLGMGLSLGGKEFNHPNDPSNADFSLGQGLMFFAGILQPFNPLGLDLAFHVGAHGQSVNEDSDMGEADISQSYTFAEAMLLRQIGKSHLLGIGGIRHFSHTAQIKRDEREFDVRFRDANGVFLEYRYALRPDSVDAYRPNIDFSLRYTLIDYVVDTLDESTMLPRDVLPEYEADRFQLRVQLLF